MVLSRRVAGVHHDAADLDAALRGSTDRVNAMYSSRWEQRLGVPVAHVDDIPASRGWPERCDIHRWLIDRWCP